MPSESAPRRPLPPPGVLLAVDIALFAVLVALFVDSRGTGFDPLDSIAVTEGPHSTLTAVVAVEVGRPSRAKIVAVADDGHRVETPWTREADTELTLDLVGLRAERTYEITVEARGEQGGGRARSTVGHTTGPLPEALPELDVAVADADRMAPGVTMFDVGSWAVEENGRRRTDPALVMIDGDGEVVWYHQSYFTVGDATLTERGTILYNYPPFGIREIDLMGRPVGEWEIGASTEEETTPLFPESPNDGVLHHVANPLPNGNVLALGSRVIRLTPDEREAICPNGYGEPFDLTDDTVIEFTRSGEIVREWAVSDMLDPVTHPGSQLCGPKGGRRDWLHTNAAALDTGANAVVVSSRNLDLVFAFRYEDDEDGPSGELLWSLGTNGTLDLEGDQPYHQHAPEPAEDGTLLVYDNGNGRPGHSARDDGQDPTYSRAVLYELDVDAGTARQVWEHRVDDLDGEPLFAGFLGDADRLPNGNVLIDHGGIDRYQPPAHGRILEVEPEGEAGGDIVLDVRLPGPWVSYRAERLPTLRVDPVWEATDAG